MNTISNGKIRIITYKDGDMYYTSALELNITSSGDDKYMAMYNLDEAIRGYLDFSTKESMSDLIFNQSTDPNLENMWQDFQNNSNIKSPLHIISTTLFETASFA